MQLFARIFILLIALILPLRQSIGLHFTLERGEERYSSDSKEGLEELVRKMVTDFPSYAKLWASMHLPFSNSGMLIDSEWVLGSSSVEVPRKIGFPAKYSRGIEGHPSAEGLVCLGAEFRGKDSTYYIYENELRLSYSVQPVRNTYLEKGTSFERLALPVKRHRSTDLIGRELYLASSVVTNKNGGEVLPGENALGFVPCRINEDQDLVNGKLIHLHIENEIGLRQESKLGMRCSKRDKGSSILVRIKDSGAPEEQYQLVGIVTSIHGDSIEAALCNQGLNSWVDSHIIKQACEPAQ